MTAPVVPYSSYNQPAMNRMSPRSQPHQPWKTPEFQRQYATRQLPIWHRAMQDGQGPSGGPHHLPPSPKSEDGGYKVVSCSDLGKPKLVIKRVPAVLDPYNFNEHSDSDGPVPVKRRRSREKKRRPSAEVTSRLRHRHSTRSEAAKGHSSYDSDGKASASNPNAATSSSVPSGAVDSPANSTCSDPLNMTPASARSNCSYDWLGSNSSAGEPWPAFDKPAFFEQPSFTVPPNPDTLATDDARENMGSWLAASMGLFSCSCGEVFTDSWSYHQHETYCSGLPKGYTQ
jgi:hypothetical protein